MKFYTNVQLIGNQVLVRGVDNGKRYEHRDEFFPTMFKARLIFAYDLILKKFI